MRIKKVKKMRKTGVLRDPRFLNHQTASGHPESPNRLAAIYEKLDLSELGSNMEAILPQQAQPSDIALVHTTEYVNRIAATAAYPHSNLTADTHASQGSYEAALLAVGGLFKAISLVVTGKLSNAFALVRPPGHHAEKSRAMGFCLFNNVALGAQYAITQLGLKRVLIIDWDVHHGNGTQHLFEEDSSVLFISAHQYPHYPGTGVFTETGRGPGEGYTINIPLPRGYGNAEYVTIFERLLRPLALAFAPDLILVSAGFDIHQADPLGGMLLTDLGFAGLTRSLMNIADECCQGRLVLSLEGGYHLKALSESVCAVLNEMTGKVQTDLAALMVGANRKKVNYAIQRMQSVHDNYWPILKDL
jgi:acetoin utilization deacetylase AcuC-like enzyme